MKAADCVNREVCVMFVSDRTIKKFNNKYRGVNHATDCISFPMQEGEGNSICPELLGDIMISVETALKQSLENNTELNDEIEFLFAHSLLHLLGYDHKTEEEAHLMNKMQGTILT